MHLKEKKSILEVYGLLRMTLGISQIVGLAAGYFLLEWIVQYPKGLRIYVIDQEIIALIFLAVLLRGIFHVAVGIGIARLKVWGRMWLLYGWPVIILVTLGLIHSMYQEWLVDGYVRGYAHVFAWPKLILYAGVIAFDLTFVNQSIRKVNESSLHLSEWGDPITGKRIAAVFFIAVFLFSVLLFLGRPIREGFHRGFYKSGGKKASEGQTKQVLQAGGKEEEPSVSERTKERAGEEQVLKKAHVSAMAIQETESPKAPKKQVEDVRKERIERSMPYRALIGFAAGLSLIFAFLLQLVEVMQARSAHTGSSGFYVLLMVGFLFWTVYGAGMQLLPVTLTGAVLFGLCLGIVLLKWKSDSS